MTIRLLYKPNDYSNLTDLHVYDDLLTFYSYKLPDFVSIAEAGELYNEFSLFERKLLTLYVSYVLSKAGFYDLVIAEAEERYITKLSDNDWIEFFEALPPSEVNILEPWYWEYENEKKRKTWSIFYRKCTSYKINKR